MENFLKIVDTGYSINVKSDYKNDNKINSYIPVSKNLKLADKIWNDILNKKSSSYIISGAYGTGKSYFTAILSHILSKNFKLDQIEIFSKIAKEKYVEISEKLEKLEKENYLIVFPEDTIPNFKESVLLGVQRSIKENNLDISLNTEFDLVLEKIKNWEKNHPLFYNWYLDELKKLNLSNEIFINAINNKEKKHYEAFKTIYSNLFAGESFSSLNSLKGISEILEDFEKKLIEEGTYKGVIYIFDEFGRYLESHIETVDVKEVQDAAEYCNGFNNSALILVTHKDIFQYTRRLSKKDNINEWEKVSGRFKKEHLSFEKTNILEIISHTLNKNAVHYYKYKDENKVFFSNYIEKLKSSNSIIQAPEGVVDRYYPLNYLTAIILPDLSQKIAQNERTLFAFLNGDEAKGLKNLLINTKDKLIGLDKLYDYFEENFKFLSNDSSEYKTYLNTKNALSKLNNKKYVKEIKFLKSLAIIYIYNKNSEIEPTKEMLDLALLENTDKIYKVLNEMNLVTFRRHYNHFKLVEDVDINVDKEVAKYMEEKLKRIDFSTSLNNNLPLSPFYPYVYNERFNLTRYLGKYYLDISEDISEEVISNIHEDGKIVYVSNLENRDNYFDVIDKLKNKNLILIYNEKNEKNNILSLIRELESINGLYNGEDKYKKDNIIKSEILSYQKEVKDAVSYLLNKYFNLESVMIHIPGKTEDIKIGNKYQLINLISSYLEEKYNRYIPINYELINKSKLSAPMRKVRGDIINKLKNKVFNEWNIDELQEYFNESGAENTVARILVKKTKFLNLETREIEFKGEYEKLYLELINLFREKQSLKTVLDKYCSNTENYGFRSSIFMFIISLISMKHTDEIIYSNANGEEVSFDLELLHNIEKNPKNYNVVYLEEKKEKKIYLKKLEEIFKDFIVENSGNKTYDIFNGIKNYIYTLPRIITQQYSKNRKTLRKLISHVLKDNNSTEFILNTLPKIYKTDISDEVINLIKEDTDFINGNIKMLENEIKDNFLILLGEKGKDISEVINSWKIKETNYDSDIKLWLKNYEFSNSREFLKDLTTRIKGFDYYNWYDITEFEDFFKKLKEAFEPKIEKLSKTIIIDGEKLTIGLEDKETAMGKILKNKLNADIKNMGMTIDKDEKRKILFQILLEI